MVNFCYFLPYNIIMKIDKLIEFLEKKRVKYGETVDVQIVSNNLELSFISDDGVGVKYLVEVIPGSEL